MHPLRTLSLLLLPLSLCACPAPIPRPADALQDPHELLQAIEAATNEIHSARMKDVRLDWYGAQGRLSLRQTLLFQQPDRLRVQTYIPGFDGVAGVLVCACGRFAFHDRQEDIYYYGPATAQNVARVLPLGLSCRDLGQVLLGGAPHDRLRDGQPRASLAWDDDTGRYRLVLEPQAGQDAGARIVLQVRHKDWRVTQMNTTAGTQTLYQYTADDFAPVQGFLLPQQRRFLLEPSGDDFSLTAKDTQINPDLPPELFQLAPPDGSPRRYIGPLDPPPPPGDLCAPESTP
jgi:hypothetical protein